MAKDRFDKAVDWLTKNPDLIEDIWRHGHLPAGTFGIRHKQGHRMAACLFRKCGDRSFKATGCLTQIRDNCGVAGTSALTKAIRADERIPTEGEDITVEMLPMFAKWQRRIDKALAKAKESK